MRLCRSLRVYYIRLQSGAVAAETSMVTSPPRLTNLPHLQSDPLQMSPLAPSSAPCILAICWWHGGGVKSQIKINRKNPSALLCSLKYT